MNTRTARSRLLAVLLAVAAVSASGVGFGTSVVSAGQVPGGSGGRTPWVDLARTLFGLVPPPLIELLDGPSAIDQGSDGRLTVVLLGSDSRRGGVSRTDTIMIVSVRGNTISAVSMPRDMARIPNPNGGTYSARVNALYRQLGANEFVRVMEHVLQIEIDYYALTTFIGFHALVDEVDPITMRTREVRDTQYWDDPNLPKGIYVPASEGYELHAYQPGADSRLCNGLYQTQGTSSQHWCRRALPYIRSRKGSSDFARARRQQDFVIASIRRVTNRGSGSALNSLLNVAQGTAGGNQLITNIPLNASSASDLYNRLNGAGVGLQEVLAPPTYADHIPGGTGYELKLDAVRQLMRQHFGSTGSPPPNPTPTANPTPTRAPTPVPTPTANPTLPPGATPTVPGATATVPPTLAPGPDTHACPCGHAHARTGPDAAAHAHAGARGNSAPHADAGARADAFAHAHARSRADAAADEHARTGRHAYRSRGRAQRQPRAGCHAVTRGSSGANARSR